MKTITKKLGVTTGHGLFRMQNRNERVLLPALQVWFNFVLKQIRRSLTEKFAKDIASELTDWEFIEERGQEILRPATLKVMQSSGDKAYKLFRVQGAFDVLNPAAVIAADKVVGHLVRDVTQNTKEGIRSYIKAGIKDGKAMDKIARELRPIVGLTGRQVESVANYRKLLEDKELSPKQIDSKVRTYTNKTHRRRMKTIARTETARAQNVGYAVGLEDLGVEQLEFAVHPDEKTCEACFSLDKKRYKVGEASAVIPVHPNCRCAMLPVVADRDVCEFSKGVSKASQGCIPVENLPDEQVKDLLKRLERSKDPSEGKKLRRSLRKLGHKGGLKPGQPSVVRPPTIKPTKPVVSEVKAPRPKVPTGATKFETADDYRKALLDLEAGKTSVAQQKELADLIAKRKVLDKKSLNMQVRRGRLRRAGGNQAEIDQLSASMNATRKEAWSLSDEAAKIKAKQKVSLKEMRAVLNESDNMAGMLKGAAGKWESTADDILSWIPKGRVSASEISNIKYLSIEKEVKGAWHMAEYSRTKHLISVLSNNKNLFAHEFGHHLGYNIQGAMKTQTRFFMKRTAGEVKKKLPGYDLSGIMGKKDKFGKYDYYAGRVYKDGRAPELISVGLEHVWKNPLLAAKRDPEWFNMVMSALKKF